MERRRPPIRHELKFLINYGEYLHLSRTMDYVLKRDAAGDQYNEYAIRSLYFDTAFDDFLEEKLSGVMNRQKYRLRIYNYSDRTIKLECKAKYGDLISKRSMVIPRELAEQLIAGDPSGLERTASPLLHDMYREMRTRLLRPVVIVDYIREAYTYGPEDVRITFDKEMRTGLGSINMFDPAIPTVPVLDDNLIVLEVKFQRTLPDFIKNLLTGISAQRLAVSKYVLCRRYEEKDY